MTVCAAAGHWEMRLALPGSVCAVVPRRRATKGMRRQKGFSGRLDEEAKRSSRVRLHADGGKGVSPAFEALQARAEGVGRVDCTRQCYDFQQMCYGRA